MDPDSIACADTLSISKGYDIVTNNLLLETAGKLYFTHCQITSLPGGRLNKKDGLTRYGNSYVKDKTS